MPRSGRRQVTALWAWLAALALVWGCSAPPKKKTKKKRTKSAAVTASAPAAKPRSAVSFFDAAGAATIRPTVEARLGPGVRLGELRIFPPHVGLEVVRGEGLATYVLQGGKVIALGEARSQPGAASAAFSLAEVDLRLVPQILAEARRQLGLEPDGELVNLTLRRHPPRTDLTWRAYSPRSGWVEHDVAGRALGGAQPYQKGPQPVAITDLLKDASPIPAALRQRFGSGLRLDSLRIYRDSADLALLDPKERVTHSYKLTRDGVAASSFSSKVREDDLFRLDEVAFDRVPAMVSDAVKRLETTESAVDKVWIRIIHGTQPTYYVHMKSAQQWVSYSADGTHQRTSR